jgi:hypothetical protein
MAPDLSPDPYVTKVDAPEPVMVLQRLRSHMLQPEPEPEPEIQL